MELHRKVSGPPRPVAPLALGATPEGDSYTLAGLLCGLILRERGWEVQDLGCSLPLAALGRAVVARRPRLVWLSIHHLGESERFLQEYGAFYLSATTAGAAVILGGPALGPAIRARLTAAAFGDRMGHLAEFARRVHPGGRDTDQRGSISQ
jgi:hypothetical protein